LELHSVLRAVAIEFSEVNVHGMYFIALRAKEEPVVGEIFVQVGECLRRFLRTNKQIRLEVTTRTSELEKLQFGHQYSIRAELDKNLTGLGC
jgi:hypothetical protein